jgi:hypothetical protein
MSEDVERGSGTGSPKVVAFVCNWGLKTVMCDCQSGHESFARR